MIPNEETRAWVSDFLLQMEAIKEYGIEGSREADVLFGQMFVFPETLSQWVFGRGFNLFRNEMGVDASDVGFIQQLNYGGVFFVLIILLFVGYAFIRLIKSNNKLFGFFFLVVFLILNIKCSYVFNSGAFRIMMFLYYIFIFDRIKGPVGFYNKRMESINTNKLLVVKNKT